MRSCTLIAWAAAAQPERAGGGGGGWRRRSISAKLRPTWQAHKQPAVPCFVRLQAVYFRRGGDGYGTPLINFAIKYGPRDILQDRQAGMLVPCGDEEALAAALIKGYRGQNAAAKYLGRRALRSAQHGHASAIAEHWGGVAAGQLERLMAAQAKLDFGLASKSPQAASVG